MSLTSSLSYYTNSIKKFKILTRSEETELFKKVISGDKESYNEFFNCNLKLVLKIALSFKNNGVELKDLIQSGNIGLMKAIEKFDISLGYKFSTYATYWIKQFVTKEINDNCRTIRIPIIEFNKIRKINKIKDKISNRTFSQTVKKDQIVDCVNVNEKEYDNYIEFNMVTIIENLNKSFSKDGEIELIDTISYDLIKTPSEKYKTNSIKNIINRVLNLIDKRSKRIIISRFDLNGKGKMTLEQIADIEKVSRERIRQLEVIAFSKIKDLLSTLKIGENYESIF